MSEESRELEAWIAGDNVLHYTMFLPMVRTLSRRKFRNDYDSEKAITSFVNFVNEAALRYSESVYGKCNGRRVSPGCFPKQLRWNIAVNMRNDFEEAFAAGEYDCYKQKYLR